MIKYGFFFDDSLMITKFSGDIDKDCLISFIGSIFSKANKQELKKVINDFRDANIIVSMDELKDVLNYRVEHSKGFRNSLMSAFIIKEVKETVYTTLFASDLPSSIANAEVCSTIEYARNYLGINSSIQEIESMIANLNQQL